MSDMTLYNFSASRFFHVFPVNVVVSKATSAWSCHRSAIFCIKILHVRASRSRQGDLPSEICTWLWVLALTHPCRSWGTSHRQVMGSRLPMAAQLQVAIPGRAGWFLDIDWIVAIAIPGFAKNKWLVIDHCQLLLVPAIVWIVDDNGLLNMDKQASIYFAY